jgi:hypothetical protein
MNTNRQYWLKVLSRLRTEDWTATLRKCGDRLIFEFKRR